MRKRKRSNIFSIEIPIKDKFYQGQDLKEKIHFTEFQVLQKLKLNDRSLLQVQSKRSNEAFFYHEPATSTLAMENEDFPFIWFFPAGKHSSLGISISMPCRERLNYDSCRLRGYPYKKKMSISSSVQNVDLAPSKHRRVGLKELNPDRIDTACYLPIQLPKGN